MSESCNPSSNVRTGRLFRDGAYTDEKRWVPAEDYERLQAIVDRNKTNAVHRLHNICDALSEDIKESPFTREEWERIDKQTVEHLHTIQTQGDEIEQLRLEFRLSGQQAAALRDDRDRLRAQLEKIAQFPDSGLDGVNAKYMRGFAYAALSGDSSAPELRKLKSSPVETPPSGWRPIETAPMGGAEILTLRDAIVSRYAVAFWSNIGGVHGWAVCGTNIRLLRVTHWMSLPEPPGSPVETSALPAHA